MFSYEPLTTSGVAYTLSLHIYFTPLHSSFTLTWKHCSLVNPIIHSFRIFIQRPFTKPTQKRSQSSYQRCHSKKIKNPRRATEKAPENPRSNFYAIGLHFGKKSNFSWKKSNFFGKKGLFSTKIKVSEDLFFLFFSRQLSF